MQHVGKGENQGGGNKGWHRGPAAELHVALQLNSNNGQAGVGQEKGLGLIRI